MCSHLSPDTLLAAYATGIFPMADSRGEIMWLAPDPRAIIELDALNVSRSLRTVVRRGVFEVTLNRSFREVINACAARREGTWISEEIREAYCELHRLGFGHSVEAWQGGALAGGLYGVAIGGAFFGESMFHRVSNASKVALVWLVRRMRERGFTLLDVQFATEHLRRLGSVEIPRYEYQRRLHDAIQRRCSLCDAPDDSE
ncbi:MAG: leucyl/phenylalanyl-tRNA--protein transferase [Phycisphaerae bacterium]